MEESISTYRTTEECLLPTRIYRHTPHPTLHPHQQELQIKEGWGQDLLFCLICSRHCENPCINLLEILQVDSLNCGQAHLTQGMVTLLFRTPIYYLCWLFQKFSQKCRLTVITVSKTSNILISFQLKDVGNSLPF